VKVRLVFYAGPDRRRLTVFRDTNRPLPDILLDIEQDGAVITPGAASNLTSVFEDIGRQCIAIELPLSSAADPEGPERLESVMKALRQIKFTLNGVESPVVKTDAVGSLRVLSAVEAAILTVPPEVAGIAVMVV
jgi:hypothetical protein